ncbi:hypothetical protein FACS189445_4460 [Spirochaetia bacterium]|nr:hypothetical protein FACS189445_4460 [Spirochaetia bacterium]
MQYIIMDQYVRRRQNHPLVSVPKIRRQTVYKPYTYINEIKQHPAPVKRLRRKEPFRFPVRERPGARSPTPAAEAKAGAKKPSSPASRGLKKTFWETPVPACLLAGVALFSAMVLALQDFPAMAFSPGDDPGTVLRINLVSSAELPGPIPAAAVPEEEIPETGSIPLDLMETFQWESYRVKQGDSVSKIAVNHSISMDAIIASNGISNARRLREGEVLRIPNMDGIPYTVRQSDTLAKISAAKGVPLEAILDANDLESDTLSAGQSLFIPGARMPKEELKLALGELFIYPIRGRLTSPYGWRNDPISGARRYHAALDLAAPTGTTIKAAMDGRVVTVGYNLIYGNYIIISHGRGFQTLYGHLSATSVKQGAYVYQGGKIGAVGSTGYSTGPHLHFAVYKNNKAVNPLEYLNP